MDTIKIVLEQFTNETVNILLSLLVFMTIIMIAYWYYNRRKFHQLRHQIPASVVKNYLDSIIANSNALKSSLFRGGGLDIGEGIPSILPTSELPLGGVATTGDSSEELAQKNAEISSLKSLLNQKDVTIAELEKMLASKPGGNGEEIGILQSEVSSLKNELEEANHLLEEARNSSGGGDSEAVVKERDELKERLMEYEVIEEDLANLKRYQQENEELKKTIEELRGGAPIDGSVVEEESTEPAEEPEDAPTQETTAEEAPVEEAEPVEESVEEAEPVEESVEEAEPAEASEAEEPSAEEKKETDPEDVPHPEGEQKSAEELLSEFEKMLG